MKCSECGGDVKEIGNVYKCTKCGREKKIEKKIVETIDMSETANLNVIME
jgi:tRNA(Ile2) C34 agmatinyltransferase TiaS